VLVVSYGDYVSHRPPARHRAVGLYYFAFGLSTQTGVLLTDNLGRVLLPAFSSLLGQPVSRQRGAFVRSCRLLALLGVPLCLLQAAVAGPLVRLLFGPRWASAIPILQLLSIGMAGHLLTMPSHTLLKAQGRLRTLFVVSAVAAGCFLTVVTVAAAGGGLIVATATVAAYYLVAGFVQLGVALRAVGGRWRDLAHVCTVAFAAGGASATLAWASGLLLPAGRLYDLLRLIAIPGIGLGLHALCVLVFAPDAWRDLRATITAWPADLPPDLRGGAEVDSSCRTAARALPRQPRAEAQRPETRQTTSTPRPTPKGEVRHADPERYLRAGAGDIAPVDRGAPPGLPGVRTRPMVTTAFGSYRMRVRPSSCRAMSTSSICRPRSGFVERQPASASRRNDIAPPEAGDVASDLEGGERLKAGGLDRPRRAGAKQPLARVQHAAPQSWRADRRLSPPHAPARRSIRPGRRQRLTMTPT
jgi:hypothetical protein